LRNERCSIGLHPWYLQRDTLEMDYLWMNEFSVKPEVMAIGECGLDKLCKVSWELQLEAFHWQINLAKAVQKPMIIHCVRAQQDILKIIKEVDVIFVFHGFNRSLAMAYDILNAGGVISVNAKFLKTKQGQDTMKKINQNSVFLETDDDSISIHEAYLCLANIWQKKLSQVEDIIEQNTSRIGLKFI
jgi:TatD DNase family protein